MKGFLCAALALGVMGLGVWSYRENYATQAALKDLRALRGEIDTATALLDRLEAEWAYLNRPDRLRDLAEINFERLELLPLSPEAFGRVEDVAMPPAAMGGLGAGLGGAVAASGGAADGEEPL